MEKTLTRLKERFYWPGHHQDVCNWCHNCGVCATRKSPAPKAKSALKSIVVGYPLQLVAMDIVGPFPESPDGNTYVLVVADYFTRWTEAYPLPKQEASTVARKLVDEFFLRFSPPEQLHSDQGRNFESQIIAKICKLLGIVKSRTTPYHPQSDGLVERFNRTLLDMLSMAVTERPFEWERHLPRLCLAYNTSVHPTTGYSPFFLMFGRPVRMPIDIMYGTPTPRPSSIPKYVKDLCGDLESAYERVQVCMGEQLDRQKELYDRKTHGEQFKQGDLVRLHTPVVSRGKSRKLHRPWTGPYRVVKRLSEAVYRIHHLQQRRKRMVVHFDRLKPCPQGIRLQVDPPPSQLPVPQTVHPPHLGTNIELLDFDSTPPSSISRERESTYTSCDSVPTRHDPPAPRYPQRDRSPPERLLPVAVH